MGERGTKVGKVGDGTKGSFQFECGKVFVGGRFEVKDAIPHITGVEFSGEVVDVGAEDGDERGIVGFTGTFAEVGEGKVGATEAEKNFGVLRDMDEADGRGELLATQRAGCAATIPAFKDLPQGVLDVGVHEAAAGDVLGDFTVGNFGFTGASDAAG